MPERYDDLNDVPAPEQDYEETIGELTEEEAANEQRVLAEAKRVVPVWGVWGLSIAGVLLVATLATRGISDRGISIAQVRASASQYSGQSLKIRGRVGDVFPMVGSHVYYLLQGKDTMVVFTRGAPPAVGQVITVQGTLSVGYLDGSPRPSLFETAKE